MTGQPERLATPLPGAPEAVGEIRTAVCALARSAGFPDEKVEAIRLAISEAATKPAIHGYGEDTGQLALADRVRPGSVLRVVIADDGRGKLPYRDSDGLRLGRPLMSTLSDHLDITSPLNGAGTEVHLYFRVS